MTVGLFGNFRVGSKLGAHKSKLLVFVGVGATQLALFGSGIVVARGLGPSGRGQIATATLISSLTAFLASGGASSLLAVMASQTRQTVGLPLFAIRAMRLTIALGACISAVVTEVLLRDLLLALVSGAAALGLSLISILYAPYAGVGRYGMAAIGQVIGPGIYAALLVCASLLGQVTVKSTMILWLIAILIACGLSPLTWARATFSPSIGWNERDFRSRVFRGLFGTYSPLETFRLDQFIVAIAMPSAALGIYVSALAVANFPKLVGQSTSMLVPSMATLLNRRRLDVLLLSVVASGILVGAISPPLVTALFGAEFAASARISTILCIAGGFMGSRKVLTEYLRVQGWELVASRSEIVATAIFLPSGIFFAVRGSLAGISAALTVAAAISLGASYYSFRRRINPPSSGALFS